MPGDRVAFDLEYFQMLLSYKLFFDLQEGYREINLEYFTNASFLQTFFHKTRCLFWEDNYTLLTTDAIAFTALQHCSRIEHLQQGRMLIIEESFRE